MWTLFGQTRAHILKVIKATWSFPDRGSSCSPCPGKNLRLKSQLPAPCPACLWHLSQPLQGNPDFIFPPMNWDLLQPIRTALIVSSFVFTLNNQSCVVGTAQFWKHICMKLEILARTIFFIKDGLPFLSVEHNLSCSLNLCIPVFSIFHSNTSFLFSTV